MRREYPSDISREQFKLIEPELKNARKTTRPPKYDLYEIFCAILYLIKEGCTWRAIPHDFPKWEAVRYYYDIWTAEDEYGISLLDEILDKLAAMQRQANGRDEFTTMVIVDSKSIQNADTAQSKGYDAGKKNPE